MSNGKIFSIIGGVLTLASTYVLGFGYAPVTGSAFFGIGFIMNMDNIFEDPFPFSTLFGGLDFVVYLLVVVLIIFLISGFLQIAGIKKRTLAIIGSILPIFISLVFISDFYDVLIPEPVTHITSFFWTQSIVKGIVPLHVIAGTTSVGLEVSLGTYILLGGGVLGMIGGILGND